MFIFEPLKLWQTRDKTSKAKARRMAMTAQLITSGQKRTLNRVVHDATIRACRELGLTKEATQRVLGRGDELSFGIKQLVQSLSLDPNLLQMNSASPFIPEIFIGEGWSIAELHERAFELTEVDLNKVRFETMLRSGETSVEGEEKLRRLKEAGHIPLDATIFLALWRNQALIPEDWKTKGNIFFDGTVLRNHSGRRYLLYLYWNDGEWFWDCSWLDCDWNAKDPSACLAN